MKWKGYPDLDNQWVDAKDMENTQELIAEFHDSNPESSSHIKRAIKCLSNPHLPSTLPSTLTSDPVHMSDVSNLIKLPFGGEENSTPLPIPPCTITPDVTQGQLCIQNQTPSILCIQDDRTTNVAGSNFPHPDDQTPSKLNDSNQENIAPPVPTVPHTHTPVRPLGRTSASISFTDDPTMNQAILVAITRVWNTVHHNEEYVGNIEEIICIARALQHSGSPSKDDEMAALVA